MSLQKDPSGRGCRGAEVGIQVPAAQHTLALFSLTLNPFYTCFDEQLLLWCRSLSMNLPGAQVTPRCCWPPVGSGSTDPWDSVRGWCDPAQLRGCGGKLRQLRDSGIVSGFVTVTAQLPRAGPQTPLLVTWDFCDAWRLVLGALAAVPLQHEWAPEDSARECWWLQHFTGGISQDFGLLLDFRWNFFLLCGHISQVALCLFYLSVIFAFSFWDWYMCPHTYIYNAWYFYTTKSWWLRAPASCTTPPAVLQFPALIRGLEKWWQPIAPCMKDSRLYETDISL